MAILTWMMPGVNALLVRWRRPDLVRNAPFGKALPWLGLVWLVFPVWIYFFAVGKPIKEALSGTASCTTSRRTASSTRSSSTCSGSSSTSSCRSCAREGRGHEDALHGDPAGLGRRDRNAALHRERLPRRREGVAQVPERDPAGRLQGGRRARRRRPDRQGDRADRGARRRLRDRALRRPAHRPRRRGAGEARARHRRRRLLLVRDDGRRSRAAVGRRDAPRRAPAPADERAGRGVARARDRAARGVRRPLYLMPGTTTTSTSTRSSTATSTRPSTRTGRCSTCRAACSCSRRAGRT